MTAPQLPKAAVYHVLNHNISSSWDVVLAGLKRGGVLFNVVSREEWLDRVAKSDPDGARNPTIKLLVSTSAFFQSVFALIVDQSFYRNRFSKVDERPPMSFSVDLTSKVSPSIASVPSISEELVCKWVDHWRAAGFLTK